MRNTWRVMIGLLALLVVTAAASDGRNRKIAMIDECDPTDPNWAPPPGCFQKSGDVTRQEFDAQVASPLSVSTVGHPSWRNDPSYLVIDEDEEVRVQNEGGRPHTFTKVKEFGGGRVPPLNRGLTMAPECALAPGAVDPTEVPPGYRLEVKGRRLDAGVNRFQCCFHPWMRAAIKVTDERGGHKHDR